MAELEEPIKKMAAAVSKLEEVSVSLRLVQDSLPDSAPTSESKTRTGFLAEEVQDVLMRLESERRVLEREKKVSDQTPRAPSRPERYSSD
jgi:hypothetical protein